MRVTPQPANGWIKVEGGYARSVIELANPEPGGRDPSIPLVLAPVRVRGVLRIGHTFDRHDPAAPIWVEENAILPGSASYADLRCGWCVTRMDVAYDDAHGETFAILQHTRSCRWLRRLAQTYPKN